MKNPLGRIGVTRLIRRLPGRLEASNNPRVQVAYRAARRAVRSAIRVATPLNPGWVSMAQRARWVDDRTFEVSGFAYERGYGVDEGFPTIAVRAHAPGLPPVALRVEHRLDPDANLRIKSTRIDYRNTAFVARLDASELVRLAGPRPRRWRIEILVVNDGIRSRGVFRRRQGLSSVYHPEARWLGGVEVCPEWEWGQGLLLRVGRPAAVASAVAVEGRELCADLHLDLPAGAGFAKAELVSCQGAAVLAMENLSDVIRVHGRVPAIDPARPSSLSDEADEELYQEGGEEGFIPVLTHRLVVTDTAGGTHPVHAPGGWGTPAGVPYPYTAADGTLRVRDAATLAVVTSAAIGTDPVDLRIGGTVAGDLAGLRFAVVGPRARRPIELDLAGDRSFTGRALWMAGAWGRPAVLPMAGLYEVAARTAAGRFPVVADDRVVREAPTPTDSGDFRGTLGVNAGRQVAVQVRARLRPDEIGAYQQERLRRRYQAPGRALKEQFYFESFRGKLATCNPLAIDRELAARFPEIPRVWGVMDASVPVPEGATRVLASSEAWWDARHSSRYVVTNEWLKNKYRHMPGQLVLQTWHGSMLKRIGLDRVDQDIVDRRNLLAERANWDFFLSQNPHSTAIIPSAYAWDKEIWDEGYPRNDALRTGSGEPIRKLLGIDDDRTVLLYAPTWRENQTEMVTFLDTERLMADLGPDYLLLLRGHSRTMDYGEDVHTPGVIDVTSYPDITDLFLASDALITDYSSVMFDYGNTGRPMIFFVPDMDDYRDSLRGVYFDLSEVAPGPVLATQDEVLAAVGSMAADEPVYRERYAAWQTRFTPWDDGHSAQRIVDRLLAAGNR